MKAFYLAAIFVFVASAFCVTPSELSWERNIGYDKKNPEILYSLLSLGGFRAELSNDFGAKMKEWLSKHPHAILRPIVTRQGLEKKPNSKIVIVWITDGAENLNVHLVRNGCVGAGQMLAITDEDPDIQRELGGVDKDKLQVPIAEYRSVRKQLIDAEEKAKQERLGIWAKPAEERTDD